MLRHSARGIPSLRMNGAFSDLLEHEQLLLIWDLGGRRLMPPPKISTSLSS
jgi:hypothetical protein